MRSAAELRFRARQEIRNLWHRVRSTPPLPQRHTTPLSPLPDAESITNQLRTSRFAGEVRRIADDILQGRFALPGGAVDLGRRIDWRRDYRHQLSSPLRYFRRVPYLDFQRVGDHKVVWDLNRHQHFVVLAQAYCFTGNRSYVETIEQHLFAWTDENPFMRGINWTSALEVAFRALSWAWTLHLTGGSLSTRASEVLLRGLYLHGLYIETNLSIYFSPNTHLLGEAVALHALGVLLPTLPRAAAWRRTGAELVAAQMRDQVREDGTHFEQSSYYHVYALDMFLFHAVLCAPDPLYRQKLTAMADYLDALLGPPRSLPLMGDDDGGRFFHPYGPCERFGRATLATCSALLGAGRWHAEPQDFEEQAVWWLGASALEGVEARKPQGARMGVSPTALFRDAGVAIMRSEPVQVIVDGGSFGAGSGGHSHSDTLHLIVRTQAEELLIDPGTYTYVADTALRNWFRGSIAHNTLRIDERDQATPSGPFRWSSTPVARVNEWKITDTSVLFDATCVYGAARNGTGRADTMSLRRRVVLVKSGEFTHDLLLVCDTAAGAAGSHVVEQLWHPGEPFVVEMPTAVRIGRHSHLIVPEDCRLEIAEGWRSRCFADRSPSPYLVVRRVTPLPASLWAALAIGPSRVPRLRVDETGRHASIDIDDTRMLAANLDASGGISAQIQPRQ
jgi:hypothetical protein